MCERIYIYITIEAANSAASHGVYIHIMYTVCFSREKERERDIFVVVIRERIYLVFCVCVFFLFHCYYYSSSAFDRETRALKIDAYQSGYTKVFLFLLQCICINV